MAIHVIPHNKGISDLPVEAGDYVIDPDGDVIYISGVNKDKMILPGGTEVKLHHAICQNAGHIDDLQYLVREAPRLIAAWREKYQMLSDDEAGDD